MVRAQPSTLVGRWQGSADVGGQTIFIELLLGPDGQFSQRATAGVNATLLRGTYQLMQDTLTLAVFDWEPKTQRVYVPMGTTGGYWEEQPTSQPPGGTYRVTLTSADSMNLTDLETGATIALRRA
jgi:hypothetical protein